MDKKDIEEEQKKNRLDYSLITNIVNEKSKVIDIGCGTGTLLSILRSKKDASVKGIEIDAEKAQQCVKKGLSVLHGDADEELKHYPANSFDYVIFNETIQVVKNSLTILKEALRVGKKVIVSFPNFANWQIRFSFLIRGRMPKSRSLPYEWYDTPNIRVLTTRDFNMLCTKENINILKRYNYIKHNGKSRLINIFPNLLATNSLFLLSKKEKEVQSRK